MLIYHKNTVWVGSRKAERRIEFNQEEMEGEKKCFYIEKNKKILGGFGKHHIQETQCLLLTEDIVEILCKAVPLNEQSLYTLNYAPELLDHGVFNKLFSEKVQPGKVQGNLNFLVLQVKRLQSRQFTKVIRSAIIYWISVQELTIQSHCPQAIYSLIGQKGQNPPDNIYSWKN